LVALSPCQDDGSIVPRGIGSDGNRARAAIKPSLPAYIEFG